MEELSMENILHEEDVQNLFLNDSSEENSEENQEEDLFNTEEENKEVVPQEPNEQEMPPLSQEGQSPNNFYSSIAHALREDGILSVLQEGVEINSPEEFANLMREQVKTMYDESQNRISEALELGISPDVIREHEKALSVLNSIDETSLSDEGEKGVNIRKNLIYQDYINRGLSQERALREVEKSFKSGTDIDDAKEALNSNIEFYTQSYNNTLEERKREKEEQEAYNEKLFSDIDNNISQSRNILGGIEVPESYRNRAREVLFRQSYKDKETGEYLTELQAYQKHNYPEFLKNVAILYALTDGFKNTGNLIKGKVNKEVRSSIANLENTINNTSRDTGGNIRFSSGVDPESSLGTFTLDI